MKSMSLAWMVVSFGLSNAVMADVAQDLAQLVSPQSEGGAAVTSAELQTFLETAKAYSAEEALHGISLYEVLKFPVANQAESDPTAGSQILQAFRWQVDGLAQPLTRFPGLAWSRCGDSCLAVNYRAQSPLKSVSIVYTVDEWQTASRLDLIAQDAQNFRASVTQPAIAHASNLRYAVRLTSPDGRSNWFNNPREQTNEVRAYHLNYSIQLASLGQQPQVFGSNPYVPLLSAYTLPASAGGAVITNDEFSSLVEQLTWFGGTDLDLYSVNSEVSQALADLKGSGVEFEGLVYENMQNFLSSARQQSIWASYPAVQSVSLPNGQTALRFHESQLQAMTLTFSTDGWNTVFTVPCQRDHSSWLCPLGALPLPTMIAYRPRFITSNGREQRPSVLGGHPFFQELK